MQALMLLHTLHIVYEGHFGCAIAADLSLHPLWADSAHTANKQSI